MNKPEQVGEYLLLPVQRDSLHRLIKAISQLGGALLANPPGTGKTVIALALAARHASVLIIAPAALREHWIQSARKANVSISFRSIELLSRSSLSTRHTLIVIDEAHNVRNTHTVRYRNLAQLCIGKKVLLLTATPVVNSRADRDALLALFLGERSRQMPEHETARCIIRYQTGLDRSAIFQNLLPLQTAADVPGLLDRILTLPSPIVVESGSPAASLIRLSLGMAWLSSLAALDAALKRRIHRGLTLDDAMRDGRAPSRAMLSCLLMDDVSSQLGFTQLVPSDKEIDLNVTRSLLNEHLDAVRAIRLLIAEHIDRDTLMRSDALRTLISDYPDRRTVVFASHADTIRALWLQLRTCPGTVALTGRRIRAAAGRWQREEILNALGPDAKKLGENNRKEIRLLLTTDILSEGVELQGVGIIVHADQTWTPARHEQRDGRLGRPGTLHDEIFVTRFVPPADVDRLLSLKDRLAFKDQERRWAVKTGESLSHTMQSIGSVRTTDDKPTGACNVSSGTGSNSPSAGYRSPDTYIAVVENRNNTLYLSGNRASNWTASTDLPTLSAYANARPCSARHQLRDRVIQEVRNWLRDYVAESLISEHQSALAGRLHHAICLIINSTQLACRRQKAKELQRVTQLISRNWNAGLEQSLSSILKSPAKRVSEIESALLRLGSQLNETESEPMLKEQNQVPASIHLMQDWSIKSLVFYRLRPGIRSPRRTCSSRGALKGA